MARLSGVRPYLIRYMIEWDPFHKRPRIHYQSCKTGSTDQGHFTWLAMNIQGVRNEVLSGFVYSNLGVDDWQEDKHYDVVNPFGDDREERVHSVWVIDFINGILTLRNPQVYKSISIEHLRQQPRGHPVRIEDMEEIGPAVPSPLQLHFTPDTNLPYWTPTLQISPRLQAFTHRILHDFNHQWRHVLRSNYNDVTLRALSCAIIRLATLDFSVEQETNWRFDLPFHHVWITKLPTWEPYPTAFLRIGSIYIVLCQSIENGLAIASTHAKHRKHDPRNRKTAGDSNTQEPDYMILSIKHIMLCHMTPSRTLLHTAPEPLFNGNHNVPPPSDTALNYLIWPFSLSLSLSTTPISIPHPHHKTNPNIQTKTNPAPTLLSLPTELQDLILSHISPSAIYAAKVGCELGIGSLFLWKDGGVEIRHEEQVRELLPTGPGEVKVMFGGVASGVAYRRREEEEVKGDE